MEDYEKKNLDIGQSFDINKVSFKNVNEEFENEFKNRYRRSLNMMSDNKDRLNNNSGATSLAILEKMAQRIDYYDQSSDFGKSYENLLKEYEPFTET